MSSRLAPTPLQWGARLAARFPFTFRLRACGVYLFAIVIGYLAAAYLGTFFAVFATMFILLPLISLLLLLIVHRYRQIWRFD